MWDTEKGELWRMDYKSKWPISDLRISGDRSRIFCLNLGSIQAYSIQTGEFVGRVEVKVALDYKSLIVDGSRVWISSSDLTYMGWDFGIPGSLPVELHNIPPYKLHSSGAISWDVSLSNIKDQATGNVVFQLSRRFTKPVDAQWNGQHLVLCYTHKEVLILDFSYLFLV